MRTSEVWIGLVTLATALLVFFLTRDFPGFQARGVNLPGPSFFPNFIAGLLVLCAALQFVDAYRKRRKGETQEAPVDDAPPSPTLSARGSGLVTLIVLLVAGVLYGVLLERVGLQVLTFLLSTIAMLCFRVRASRAVLYSVILVIVMVLVFERMFRVPLPYGIFHL